MAQPGGEQADPPVKADSGWAEIRIMPELDVRDLSRQKYNARRFLQTKQSVRGRAVKDFNEYFQLYLLPQLTQPANLAKAPEIRDELQEYFGAAAKANNQEGFEHLTGLALEYAQMIVHSPVRAEIASGQGADVLWNGDTRNPVYWKLTGEPGSEENKRGQIAQPIVKRLPPQKKFHPACRYNAMLLIGQLNEKMTWNATRKAFDETPLRNALGPMVAAAGDESLPEAVRLAAMLGIQRQIDRGGLPAGAIDLICGVMTRVSKEKTTATGHLADGHQWIRRQAINLIGACGAGSTGTDYSTPLTQRLVDLNEPLPVRLAAATALAKLLSEKKQLQPGEAADLSTKLATLAVDMSRYELDPSPLKHPQFSSGRAADGFDCVVLALGGKSGRAPVAAAAGGQAAKPLGVLHAAPESEQAYVRGLIDRVAALRSACASSPSEAALRGTLSDGARDISSYIAAGPEAAVTEKAEELPETKKPEEKPKESTETNPF